MVVIDDGSDEETKAWLRGQDHGVCKIHLFDRNRGRAAARNAGVRASNGAAIVFLDSDVIVRPDFLARHAAGLGITDETGTDDLPPRISIGRVVDTFNLEAPCAEPPSPRDWSLAQFPTANVAIGRRYLDLVQESPDGPFDEHRFTGYGWEDLELGYRLSKHKLERVRSGEAVGFHYSPPFTVAQLPALLEKELQRAATAQVFYAKHPTWEVRLMVQKTPLHRLFWELVSLGGLLGGRTLHPLLSWLVERGRAPLALAIARLFILGPAHIRRI